MEHGVSLRHGKVFFAIAVFPREPVRFVVGLTGHTAREPVVMHPSVWDHEVPLVMLSVNLLFTRQVDLSLVLRKCAITKFRG